MLPKTTPTKRKLEFCITEYISGMHRRWMSIFGCNLVILRQSHFVILSFCDNHYVTVSFLTKPFCAKLFCDGQDHFVTVIL